MVPDEILGTPRGGPRGMFRDLAALLLDRHLRRLVRVRQPVDLRIGRLLARMHARSDHLALGFARLSDYATERLGLPARRVQTLLDLAHRLDELPRLAAAFEAGDVSLSQVRVLLRVATAANEATWLELAAATTVRRLENEVRAAVSAAESAQGPPAGEADTRDPRIGAAPGDAGVGGDRPADDRRVDDDDAEAGEFIGFDAPVAVRALWEQALELARRSAGAGDPVWRSVEFIVADYLAGVPDLAGTLARMEDAGGAAAGGIGDGGIHQGAGGGVRCSGAVSTGGASHCRDADVHAAGVAAHADDVRSDTGVELFEEILAAMAADPESRHEAFPADRPTVVLPDSVQEDPADTAAAVDARLRALVRLRQNVSWNLGKLLRLFADRRLHRELGFMSFARWCRERLGLGVRRAWHLVSLERRLVLLPRVAEAYRAGTLSWVKASALARVATETSEGRWLQLAAAVTVRRLLEEVALAEAGLAPSGPPGLGHDGRVQLSTPTRTSNAGRPGDAAPVAVTAHVAGGSVAAGPAETGPRTRIRFWAPHDVASLWHEALAICRERAGRPLDDWECVRSILASFVEAWAMRADPTWRRRYRIFERDGWRCRVPGCTSRRNLQVHHIEFRSRGGGDDDANLAALCATHHLQGIHRGRLRCHALPGGLLAWEFGPGASGVPIVRYVEDVEWSAARFAVTHEEAAIGAEKTAIGAAVRASAARQARSRAAP